MAVKITNCPHTDRPHHAKGMCKTCYAATLEANKRILLESIKATNQLAKPKQPAPAPAPKPEPKAINSFDGAVIQHVVRCMIVCGMDAHKAAKKFAPNANAELLAKIEEQIRTDTIIQAALQHDLHDLGLDENAKKEFIAEMWRWLKNENDPRIRATAARVFAKAFIAERIEEHRVEELPIQDFKAGLEKMLGGDDDKKGTVQ